MIINDYLKEKNITKYQFAKACGLPYGTLNDICNLKTDIAKCSGYTLIKISRSIGVTVDELLNESQKLSNIKKIKDAITPIAKKHQLKSVYVFGSYARNEQNNSSDIDILIDREGSDIHGVFSFYELKNEMSKALNKEIDLITTQSFTQQSTRKINADFIENVVRERIKIYGK